MRAVVANDHSLGLKPQECTVWLEGLHQSVGRAWLPLKALGKDLFQTFSSLLVDFLGSWQQDSSLHVVFSLCLCLRVQICPLHKDASLTEAEAHPTSA